MKNWRKVYIKIRNFFIRYRNKIRYIFRIEIRNKKPVLVIPDKQERKIKWVLRVLLFIGIFSSIISFSFWFYAVLFSIFLVLVEQFLERTIFTSGVFYIQPIPDWDDYKKAQWDGMCFLGVLKEQDEREKPIIDSRFPYSIGMVFTGDLSAIKRLFNTIHRWNYSLNADKENNINLSFIIEENGKEYTTYIYPSLKRKSAEDVFRQAEQNNQELGKETEKFIMQMVLAKRFKLKGSYFEQFKDLYHNGEPYYFYAYFVRRDSAKLKPLFFSGNLSEVFKPIDGTPVILKKDLKIKNRRELTRKDIEYEHGRLVMEK